MAKTLFTALCIIKNIGLAVCARPNMWPLYVSLMAETLFIVLYIIMDICMASYHVAKLWCWAIFLLNPPNFDITEVTA